MEIFARLVPDWSGLRTLGQSRILALTALVPFLGTLILFNEQIVSLLLLSPELVSHWLGLPDQGTSAASRTFSINRLVITYFGLVFLGSAAFLFTLLCPKEVKRHGNVLAYVEAEKPLITSARTSLLVTRVVTNYLQNHGEEEAQGIRALRLFSYPFELIRLFEEVVNQISLKVLDGTDADIYSGNGNIYVERVARMLSAQRRVQRNLWMPFHAEAEQYSSDLLTLMYTALDHSRPIARMIIAFLYTLGFLVLLYPTVSTMLLILRRAISL
jgi:hypothetical protein